MRAFGLVAAALLSGCYVYRPSDTPTLERGVAVRVRLTEAGTTELAGTLGPNLALVDGQYVSGDQNAVALEVNSVQTRGGITLPRRGDSVLLSRDAIASLERRIFSRRRTALLVGGVVAGAAVVVAVGNDRLGGRAGGSPNPPTTPPVNP